MNTFNFTDSRYQLAEMEHMSGIRLDSIVCHLHPAKFLSSATCYLPNNVKGNF